MAKVGRSALYEWFHARDRERIEADKDQMRMCCRSWRGIVDERGADVPFSTERLDALVGLS